MSATRFFSILGLLPEADNAQDLLDYALPVEELFRATTLMLLASNTDWSLLLEASANQRYGLPQLVY